MIFSKNKNMLLEIRKNALLLIFMLTYSLGNAQIAYVSDFHKKNTGKTFLSNHKINFGKETEADFTDEFKEGDPIFVVRYLDKPLSIKDENSFEFKFSDKNVVYIKTCPLDDNFGDKQTVNVFQFALVPPINDSEIPGTDKANMTKVVECVSKPTKVKHWALIVVNYKKLDFQINYSENKRVYESLLKELTIVQGDLVKVSKAGMADASVDAAIKKYLSTVDESELNFKGCKVLKTIIIPSEWNYEKAPYTKKIENRYLDQVHVLCRDDKNQCFMLSVDYKQFLNGGSYGTPLIQVKNAITFGPESIAGDENNRLYFNCNKLK